MNNATSERLAYHGVFPRITEMGIFVQNKILQVLCVGVDELPVDLEVYGVSVAFAEQCYLSIT